MSHALSLRILLLSALLTAFGLRAADPTATQYTAAQCLGSYMPYPAPESAATLPDTLEALALSHVGRHGARFLSSSRQLDTLQSALERAAAAGTITAQGRALQQLCEQVRQAVAGRWGALNDVGIAEQTGIATRMFQALPELFNGTRVNAFSSYSPRCIMSMYTVAHQLSRLDNNIELYTSSGRQNSPLLRPFDDDVLYREYVAEGAWRTPLDDTRRQLLAPYDAAAILGEGYPSASDREHILRVLTAQYDVLKALPAMGMENVLGQYYSEAEMNALWAVDNLEHYLRWSASTLTPVVTEMAAPLLLDILTSLERVARGEAVTSRVTLRFAHAETLMPLLALAHIPGGYYMTNHWDTVATHWRDFYLVPMAANLRFILARHRRSGKLYLRTDLNERPVTLVPGRKEIYVPWEDAREYIIRCLPLILQP